MQDKLKISLQGFVDWVKKHLRGDEKGEAQIYLDRLFQAFGLGGVKEAGGTLEERIKKRGKRGLTTGYADYVWKPVVLIEMKKRGEKLRKHQPQAFQYWVHLAPNRPRWVILCNFDEFWIYDFDTQIDEPVDRVRLEELPERYTPLNFLRPESPLPKFRHDLEAVTRGAADELVALFNALVDRGIEKEKAQRFVLQCLVALFSEDIGLLEKFFFTDLLEECTTPQHSYDLIGGLFTEMDTPGKTPGGRFKGVHYFNGGLFSNPARIELQPSEIERLKEAAKYRWELVRPEIFGTIFEHSMGKKNRHALGAHFTSATDIMKIVGPTIVNPWQKAIEGATTQKQLRRLRERLQSLKILDPACGSGNFLYVAYRELKRLEARILEKIGELSTKEDSGQIHMGFVTAGQFYGIDIEPFAIELAKVTMMIARKLAIDELDLSEAPLPLDNLDSNFLVADALLEGESQRVWPETDIIIGNPPFLGAKRLLEERGGVYLKRLRAAYPDLSGMVDYCVYWFGKTHKTLSVHSDNNPFGGRAGLVGTQNIRFGDSCTHGLSAIEEDGGIFIEAVDNHPWSGEANVNVSIVNWLKVSNEQASTPPSRRLWSYTDGELEVKEVKIIPPDLSTTFDIRSAKILSCNRKPKVCFQGVTPGATEFFLTQEEKLIVDDNLRPALRPFLGASEMVSGKGAHRTIIDFTGLSLLKAKSYKPIFEIAYERIFPLMEKRVEAARKKENERETKAREGHLEQWWLFWRSRPELLEATRSLTRCIASPRHGRYHVLMFVNPNILLGDALQIFAFEDDYSFGILQSSAHEFWWKKSSRLKNEEDIRYAEKDIFAKFPWPQNPSVKDIRAVVKAVREVHTQREIALQELEKGGLRAVYSALKIPGRSPLKNAHKILNKAVLRAYGFDQRRDTLEQLLELNHYVYDRLENKEKVIKPGIPPHFPKPETLIGETSLNSSDLIGD